MLNVVKHLSSAGCRDSSLSLRMTDTFFILNLFDSGTDRTENTEKKNKYSAKIRVIRA